MPRRVSSALACSSWGGFDFTANHCGKKCPPLLRNFRAATLERATLQAHQEELGEGTTERQAAAIASRNFATPGSTHPPFVEKAGGPEPSDKSVTTEGNDTAGSCTESAPAVELRLRKPVRSGHFICRTLSMRRG